MNGTSRTVSGLIRFAGSPPGLLGSSLLTALMAVVPPPPFVFDLPQPVESVAARPRTRNPTKRRFVPAEIMRHLGSAMWKSLPLRGASRAGATNRDCQTGSLHATLRGGAS